ncbi:MULTISPECIES: hypothetical protein [unclassified Mesorhizobium]|uniref:hypothetical protein n=2 Tax=unclassified Mesorhizobium TaxID=325217 RepID=UPI0003CF6797|nr:MULTISPECIES: hypothetical protein [unclassified Mesorhizobium]ESX57880.1 hypothetical protein X761_08260 [Mesorhizobium sp. LSHC424B00]
MAQVYACQIKAAQAVGVDFEQPILLPDLKRVAELRARCIVEVGLVQEKAAALCLALHDNYNDYAACLDDSSPTSRTATCRHEHEYDDDEYRECMAQPVVKLRSSYAPRPKGGTI